MIPTLEIWLDFLLAILAFSLAWRALAASSLHESAILFIAFGLTLALIWTRLSAPDVALAEAAVGAGVLGVLLLDALRLFGPSTAEARKRAAFLPVPLRWLRRATTGAILLVLALLAVTLATVIALLPDPGGLAGLVQESLPESGVAHPVTAVLLNFRSLDTWLEIGVLLLAIFGMYCAGGRELQAGSGAPPAPQPLIAWLVRALVPVMVLAAGYLLWLGKFAPGGAFQAGVVLGAAGILLHLAGYRVLKPLPPLVFKGGLILGFATFLAIGLASLLAGRAFLEYRPKWAGETILLLESTAALSIGLTLAAFFILFNTANLEPAKPHAD